MNRLDLYRFFDFMDFRVSRNTIFNDFELNTKKWNRLPLGGRVVEFLVVNWTFGRQSNILTQTTVSSFGDHYVEILYYYAFTITIA